MLLSCIDQKDYSIKSLDASPSIVIPLTYGSVSIKDFINSSDSSYIKTGSDGSLSLVYSTQLLSQQIRGLFSIPNSTSDVIFDIPAIPIASPVSEDIILASQSTVVDLGISPAQLSEISFKSGQLLLSTSISPSTNLKYEVIISLPDFISKSTNQPLTVQGSGDLTVSLSNYIVKLNRNKFTANVSFVLKKSLTPVSIGSNTKAITTFSLTGMDFNYIKGFFGDQSVEIPSTYLNIGAFGNSLNKASVELVQPNVNLVVLNDYGIPVTINFVTLEARKQGTNALPLILNPLNPVQLNVPITLGNSSVTSIAVSNANQVLNYAPTQLYYKASANINKNLTDGNNFLADTSKLRIKLNVNIPLYGKATGITFGDTTAIDLSNVNQSQIDEAALNIKLTNEIPLDGSVQFYLADAKYQLIDSLLTPSQSAIIKGSAVNSSGELNTAQISNQSINILKEKLNKVFTSKYIIIKLFLNTSKDSNGNLVDVKFKSQYKMTIESGLSAKLNFNVKL